MLHRFFLSPSFVQEILNIMCSGLLSKVSIFRNCDKSFISSILPHLQHEVYQEGDVIIQQNGPGDRMFLIEHGQVLVESLEKELCDGDHFGGQSVWTNELVLFHCC